MKTKTGIQLIAEERERQTSQLGWSPQHDDEHKKGELSKAGVHYANVASIQAAFSSSRGTKFVAPSNWPWGKRWWKPSPDPIRNLVKAGALLAAEIDRLQRAQR